MEITPGDIRIPPIPRTASNLSAVVSQLKVGTILEAMVVSNDKDATVLKVGDQLFQAPPGAPIKPGQTVTLRIEQLGPPLQLRIQLPQPPASALQPFSRNISQLLPQQAELPQLLSNIAHLATTTGPRNAALPEPLKQALRQLLDSMVTSRQAGNAEGIKQAIRQSGVFLERNLLAAATTPSTTPPLQSEKPPLTAPPQQPPSLPLANPRDMPPAKSLQATLARLQALAPDKPAPGKEAAPARTTTTETAITTAPAVTTTAPGDLKAALLRLLTTLQQLQTGLPDTDTNHSDKPIDPSFARTTTPAHNPPAGTLPLRGNLPLATPPGTPTLSDNMPLGTIIKELQHETQQGLARLHLLQLAGIPTPDQPNPCWSFELPIRHQNSIDLFKLQISEQNEDPAAAPGSTRSWLVRLSFNLESLGEVNAHVRLQAGKVNANIWTEFPQTAILFNEHLLRLQTRLHEQGLSVGEFNCQVGEPPQQDHHLRERNRIVDLKA